MDSILPDQVVETPEPITPTSMTSGETTTGPAARAKGRHKLLAGLQRMSSSPALAKMGRTRSTSLGSRRMTRGSMSCVSLHSSSYGQCFGSPSSSQIYGGSSALAREQSAHDESDMPVRRVDADSCAPNASGPTSIPLPTDMRPLSRGIPLASTAKSTELSSTTQEVTEVRNASRTVNFWEIIPMELRMQILRQLPPKEIIRCSCVSKAWNRMCFDGQLWASLDASDYYRDIPAEALVKIIVGAGPFLRDLNLRGCIQLEDSWERDAQRITDACRNLANICIEDCRIDKASIDLFVLRNPGLIHINLSGLTTVTNGTLKYIGKTCQNLEFLNISWCRNVGAKGLKWIASCCRQLKDLRAAETGGWDNNDVMFEFFNANSLERLVLSHCTSLCDMSMLALLLGKNPQFDCLTNRPMVTPRKLRHIVLSRCRGITEIGVQAIAFTCPKLEGLQLSHCSHLGNAAVGVVVHSTPRLSHLDLEELDDLSNEFLGILANAPCASSLEHLNISYCEKLGDTGMLQILKNCPRLRSLDLDNTRVSDITVNEICARVRSRSHDITAPRCGLRLAVFDCANVTWASIRKVLSTNTSLPLIGKQQVSKSPNVSVTSLSASPASDLPAAFTPAKAAKTNTPVQPGEIIQLKCFYGWQMAVDEHTKRVLRGDLAAAVRLERKWAEYMHGTEDTGAGGASARRRRRRAREIERLYNMDDDDDDVDIYGPAGLGPLGGRRRRARSGGCVVM